MSSTSSSTSSNRLLASEPRASSTAFDSVGVRPSRVAGADSHVTEREKKRDAKADRNEVFNVSNSRAGQRTFTHHLYHHYDPLQVPIGSDYSQKIASSGEDTNSFSTLCLLCLWNFQSTVRILFLHIRGSSTVVDSIRVVVHVISGIAIHSTKIAI